MVKVYYNRIVSEQIQFLDVPANLRTKVVAYAKEQIKAGKLTQEQFDKYFGENE